MAVKESLQLAISPPVANVSICYQTSLESNLRVKDPVLDIPKALLDGRLRLLPVLFDGVDEPVLVVNSLLLYLNTLLLEIVLKLRWLPLLIRAVDLALPILLHQLLKVVLLSGGRVLNVVIREPCLQLSLAPSAVSYKLSEISFASCLEVLTWL